ncbi:esterase/lipase family protein [Tissierellaceae bacterium HCP3S3_D8]
MDYPIVFIPGLYGSLGDDVIKGTGDFSFGFAEHIYRPFIKILNSMGYIEDENLFISYYDWKRSVLESVDRYLYPDIEKVKRKTGYDKVILIGHSLGGLLGRAYVSYIGPSSVDKLIMIGTPNLGVADAYYFWSGGKLPYPKIEDNIIYTGIKLGFILYYHLFHNIGYIDALRDMFPVVRDLLPSYRYGNYLLWGKDGIEGQVPIEHMSISNSFLNTLDERWMDIDNLFIISGTEFYTNWGFKVDIKHRNKIKWKDGKPMEIYKTNYGDGTVTTLSTLGYLGGENIIIEGNHSDILYKSRDYLSSILKKPLIQDIEEKEVEKAYVILAYNCDRIDIYTPEHNQISTQHIDIVDDRIHAIPLEKNAFWIMAMGDRDLEIKLDVKSNGKSKPKVYKMLLQY